MCLVIKNNAENAPCSKTSNNNTTCYKILALGGDEKTWVTPFQGTIVDFNKPLIADYLGDPKYDNYEFGNGYGEWVIHHGIHTFQTLKDCEDYLIDYNEYFDNMDILICECIIPKGTKYYEGDLNNDYCSERIVFVKECKKIKEYHHIEETE